MDPLIKQMLRAAATSELLRESARWGAELNWITENCMAAMLYYLTRQGEERAPCTADKRFHGAILTAKLVSQTLISAMTEIIDSCQSDVEKIVLLKGISICDQHYPFPYLRPMRDIDFLVLKKDVPKTEDILRQLGYIQKSKYPRNYYTEMHHSMPFYHPDTGVWVEVHTALFPAKSGIHDSTAFHHNNVMQNLVSSRVNGREIYRLSDELQLLYIAAHWCRDLKIIGGSVALFDTIFLLRNHPELDWTQIFSWLNDDSLRLFLYTELSYMKRNNILDVQVEFYNQLEIEFSAVANINIKILHSIIDNYIVAGKPFSSMLTSNNVGIVWKTLLQSGQPLLNLVSLPGNILFPPDNPRRFDLRFQYQRLRKSIKVSNDN
jgi:hypothetical protein